MDDHITHVTVVVPAHNEEGHLHACASAIVASARAARTALPTLRLDVIFVLDRCSDQSARVAARHPVTALAVDFGDVGSARKEGVDLALAESPVDPRHHWVITTDADTVVPRHWLKEHVWTACRGVDLVVGTVEPSGLPPWMAAKWHGAHRLVEGHGHVFGANLGFRASAYLAAGGFRPGPSSEDVDLVDRLRASGARWVATDRMRVITSGRLVGRAPAGLSTYLTQLRLTGSVPVPVPPAQSQPEPST